MPRSRHIKIIGVHKDVIDTEQLALIYWLQAKRILREKREQEARIKAKREQQRESRSER
jgi:hypothetical protein